MVRQVLGVSAFLGLTVFYLAPDSPDLTVELKASLQKADDAVKANPENLTALQDRGDALFFVGRYDEAIRDYDRMIDLNPRFGATHWQRGLALHFAGRYDDAAKQFERCYQRDNQDRENGIWRYYAQVEKDCVEAARKTLLTYRYGDRDPLPIIYQMCQGKATPQDVLNSVDVASVPADEKPKLQFYADLYVGLDAAIVRDDPAAARPLLERAVANDWPRNATYGPRFMWHIARLSLGRLDAP